MVNSKKITLKSLVTTLGFGSVLSTVLLVVGMIAAHDAFYWFLLWNLFLAWLPFVTALGLQAGLTKRGWLTWQNTLLSVIWLGFLPNSFYLISDLIHLGSVSEFWKLYDAVMIVSFIINGLLLGYISVFYVHQELLKRIRRRYAHLIIAIVFFAVGFAIYLGRYLRWNSWDLLISPAGLLFDISDRLINPAFHPQTLAVTSTFFVLIGGFYVVLYRLVAIARDSR